MLAGSAGEEVGLSRPSGEVDALGIEGDRAALVTGDVRAGTDSRSATAAMNDSVLVALQERYGWHAFLEVGLIDIGTLLAREPRIAREIGDPMIQRKKEVI